MFCSRSLSLPVLMLAGFALVACFASSSFADDPPAGMESTYYTTLQGPDSVLDLVLTWDGVNTYFSADHLFLMGEYQPNPFDHVWQLSGGDLFFEASGYPGAPVEWFNTRGDGWSLSSFVPASQYVPEPSGGLASLFLALGVLSRRRRRPG